MHRTVSKPLLALVSAVLCSCLSPNVQFCGNLVCPVGLTCSPSGTECVAEGAVEACLDVDEAQPCTIAGSGEGVCLEGVCELENCGNGVVDEATEDCEPDLPLAADCTDLARAYYNPEGLACSASCRFDDSACTGYCGDGETNGIEQCDGVPPPGASCLTFDFDRGPIYCDELCSSSSSACEYLRFIGRPRTSSYLAAGLWGVDDDNIYLLSQDNVLARNHHLERYDGSIWSRIDTGYEGALRAIWGSSLQDVWLVGNAIVHFDGTAWSTIDIGTDVLFDVWGTSFDNIWAVGLAGDEGEALIMRFDGLEWTRTTFSGTGMFFDVWADEDEAYAVGAAGDLYQFDGGNWKLVDHGLSGAFYDLWGTSANDLWVAGQDLEVGPLVGHFDGVEWTRHTTGLTRAVRSITGTSKSHVFAGGENGGLSVFDGSRWTPLYTDTVTDFATVWTSGPSVWLAGNSGVAFEGGSSFYHATVCLGSPPCEDPASTFRAVLATESGTALAVGGSDGRAIYVDGRWQSYAADLDPLMGAWDVWGHDIDDAWIVGGDNPEGVIWRLGGCTIEPGCLTEEARIPGHLRAVFGFDSGEVFAAGTSAIARQADGTWIDMGLPAGVDGVRDIWGRSPDELYLAANDGTVLHYDGEQWTALASALDSLGAPISITDNIVYSVWGTATHLWFGVGDGIVWRFDGTAWESFQVASFGTVIGISGTGDDDIFALLDSCGPGEANCAARLAHFDGAQWTAVRTQTSVRIYGIAVRPNRVFTVGSLGGVSVIVRTTPWGAN